eukprot:TRINITY_DN19890_c0_g1_i1.p2 TRINITY_DN19890_c0_g1~~TRINITY_DN19890_c0_g1_i1.p2  ORF type:complete len:246 (+),score=71.50 TRINITY_DN19890_c0_g1_i1:54-740(+)
MGARVGFVDVAAVSGVEQRVRQTLSDHSARLRGLSSGPPAVETAALRKHVFGTAAAAREVTDSVLYVAAPSAAGITPLADPSDGPRHPYLTPAVLLPHVAVAAVAEWRLECMAPPPGAAAAAVHSVLLDAVMLRRQLPDEDSCAAALADSDAEAARTEWRRLPRRLYALAREMNALAPRGSQLAPPPPPACCDGTDGVACAPHPRCVSLLGSSGARMRPGSAAAVGAA